MPFDGEALDDRVRKYDAIAESYSSRYVDAEKIFSEQLSLILGWGSPIRPGDSALEFGCADGSLAMALARRGIKTRGVDFSPKMTEVAQKRASEAGIIVEFVTGDVRKYFPNREFDVVIGLMWDFFSFAKPQRQVLRRVLGFTRRKIIVDVNLRRYPLQRAIDDIVSAGFRNVEWRPFFIPQKYRLGLFSGALLRLCAATPLVRDMILRYKFSAVIKAEKP